MLARRPQHAHLHDIAVVRNALQNADLLCDMQMRHRQAVER